ncbi:MAG: sulfate adenylyltransferase [Planctomycetes bacterium DG_20]|nr:MAG: sulfate adenylyltransferase [Planctomycetes bacterium DG_20]
MPENQVPGPIPPHGGALAERLLTGHEAEAVAARAAGLPRVELSLRERCDLELLAVGAFSPLTGFMTKAEFDGAVDAMFLPTGEPWAVPITLSTTAEQAGSLKEGQDVALHDPESDRVLAVLHLEEKYEHDRQRECREVYKTADTAHPGVATVMDQGEVCLGGPVDCLALPPHEDLLRYRWTPRQTREEFDRRGWKMVAAFQTRNPCHRAHEYLQKVALELCDGLLLHPLVGETAKEDDIPADVRMRTYEVMFESYYPKDRVLLTVLPASMRYAGPREAILHAIMRKNYGVTHFIVGRDHAGVGDYYGTYDAQAIFDAFDPQAIGIVPLKFEHAFFCRKCDGMVSEKTCPHGKEDRVFLSGTKVREMLSRGEAPPPEFTRPEVAAILIEAARQQADA